MKSSIALSIVTLSVLVPEAVGAVESFTAVCTQTEGKRYQHVYYEDEASVDKESRDRVAKSNTWGEESLFVSNPVTIRYVAGQDEALIDGRFRFRVLTQDKNKIALLQLNDDEDSYNQNTYLLDIKSMKAAYSRLRIYRGTLPGIMSGQFSLDCKVSINR